jgi:gliding motility-associated-like protein
MVITAQAQTNLVPNGDFEEYVGCPVVGNSFISVKKWQGCGSPDYFHECAISNSLKVPKNFKGYQDAKSGNAYIGIGVYDENILFREYVYCKLSDKLKKDSLYSFRISISYSDYTCCYCNSIQVLFTTQPPVCSEPQHQSIISAMPQLDLSTYLPLIEDSISWFTIDIYIKPDSAYEYLVLGNFFQDAATICIPNLAPHFSVSYLYIDDISVMLPQKVDMIEDSVICFSGFTPNNDGINDYFRLVDKIKSRINKCTIKIYDRWGNVLYYSNDKNFKWDGMYNGKKVDVGVYIWLIEYETFISNKILKQVGNVTVLY